MNVYDFDGTIFLGDTERSFFAYVFKTRGLPLYKLNYRFQEWMCRHKLVSKKTARQADYRVLKRISNIDELLEAFWDEHEHLLLPWYASVSRPDDLIATGTPRFLMEPILKRLGLKNLIATDMDKTNGKISGRFLGAHLKLEAFRRNWPDDRIDLFYSDTYSDHFLADVAGQAFVVLPDGSQAEWHAYFETHPELCVIKYRY